MAEDITQESGATSQTSPILDEDAQSAIREIIHDVVSAEVSDAYRALQGQITPLQMLRPQLEEVIGSTRKMEIMIQRIFAGNATDEDRSAIEEAVKRKELEVKAIQSENLTKAIQESQPNPEEIASWQFRNEYIPRAQRYAAKNGLNWSEVESDVTNLVINRTRSDPFGLKAWEEAAENYLEKKADEKLKSLEDKPIKVADGRPSGESATLSSIDLIKRGLEARRK